ncbi:MAG: RHS repeat-associated core domain-containing protein [Agathobacter sp.]
MTWVQGRRLEQMIGDGQTLSFTYNADGIRTSKTVNGVTRYYHLAGTQILSEEWTDADDVQHLIVYHYDASGQPVGMSYRNSTYYEYSYDSFLFVKNLQGDIIKVLDNHGDLLVSYTYDAWGDPTSITYSNGGAYTAVVYNPFRYRGYYFDSETGLYYLNSRYYDPTVGRFINDDVYVSTGLGLLCYMIFN